MVEKTVPLTKEQAVEIIKNHPTPFHVYDEHAIKQNAQQLLDTFSTIHGFKEYFAVKALPNPHVMKLLHSLGFGMDCSSLAELLLCEKLGISGEDIMFTSNDTPLNEFKKCKEMGAIMNFDDISHIDVVHNAIGLPELVCFRFNPGPEREGNVIIGDPKEAKYGFTREQLKEGYKKCKELGVNRFGLHAMIVSNELDTDSFANTAGMLYELVIQIKKELDIDIEFVNIGGGWGIPYKPEDEAIVYSEVTKKIKEQYDKIIGPSGLTVRTVLECGRIITGPYGWLITTVRHMKHTYKEYVGCDASMANLMRPGMYGAYHHITVLGKEKEDADHTYDVTGSLCENNDKFAIDRALPAVEVGDILAIHDTGAHGHAMGFNYNGKLRSAELLLKEDGSIVEIRRAETMDDHFATLDFSTL